jgi:hypothetical protein
MLVVPDEESDVDEVLLQLASSRAAVAARAALAAIADLRITGHSRGLVDACRQLTNVVRGYQRRRSADHPLQWCGKEMPV